MTDTAFEKLTAMWRSGEIDDDEFRLATKYFKAELAKAQAGSSGSGTMLSGERSFGRSLGHNLSRLIVPRATLEKLLPWQLGLVEIAVFVVVFGGGALLLSSLVAKVLIADMHKGWDLHPVGAAGWTVILLAVGGVFVGYNRRALAIISVPLFLVFLLSPLWEYDQPAPRTAAHSVAAGKRSTIEMMEIAFQGGYARAEIEALLNATMPNFGAVPTDAERLGWGDVLVVLRKDSGVQEMEILRCMHALGPQSIKFSDAAVICATTLSAK